MLRPDDSASPTNDAGDRGGLTIREYFACHIFAGMAGHVYPDLERVGLADTAVEAADALIAALNKFSASAKA